MKLSELKGEKALDVLAEIIEPAVAIMQDKDVVTNARKGNTLGVVKVMCKSHKREVITILAALEEQNPDTYEVGLLTLPAKLLELLNDPEIQRLFTPAGQTSGAQSSGPVSVNTKDRKAQNTSSDTSKQN